MRKVLILQQNENEAAVLRQYLQGMEHITVCCLDPAIDDIVKHVSDTGCEVLIGNQESLAGCSAAFGADLPLLVCLGSSQTLFSPAANNNIFAYLYQPFSYERVLSLMQNIEACLASRHTVNRRDYVFVKSEYKLIKVNLPDILFLSGLRDYTQVYLKSRTSPLVTLQNLKDFEARLPGEIFMRVHRSYIVSIDHIEAISRNEISVASHLIPIGSAYRHTVDMVIARYS